VGLGAKRVTSGMGNVGERKMFFFEKKNQKTFATFGRSRTQAPESDSERQEQKFFGSFFQKRTTSFPSLLSVVCQQLSMTER
jgi:hypothetical protein